MSDTTPAHHAIDYIEITVRDVAQAKAFYAAAFGWQFTDGRIVEPPFDFPGGRRFHFADPSGNVLAVWSLL